MFKDANSVPFSTPDGRPPATPTQPVTVHTPTGPKPGWVNGGVVVMNNSGSNSST